MAREIAVVFDEQLPLSNFVEDDRGSAADRQQVNASVDGAIA